MRIMKIERVCDVVLILPFRKTMDMALRECLVNLN